MIVSVAAMNASATFSNSGFGPARSSEKLIASLQNPGCRLVDNDGDGRFAIDSKQQSFVVRRLQGLKLAVYQHRWEKMISASCGHAPRRCFFCHIQPYETQTRDACPQLLAIHQFQSRTTQHHPSRPILCKRMPQQRQPNKPIHVGQREAGMHVGLFISPGGKKCFRSLAPPLLPAFFLATSSHMNRRPGTHARICWRYINFRAEHLNTTPAGRSCASVSPNSVSQTSRSTSVSATPACILA